MRRYRLLADFLTELRLLIGLLMVLVTWNLGRAALPFLAIGQLVSWTSDALDGPLARRAPQYPPGFVGRHDLIVDVIQAACLLCALVLGPFIDIQLALYYAILAALILFITHFSRSLAMALQGPVYVWLIAVSFQTQVVWGWLLVGWIALALLVTWPRFPRRVVPEFLAGVAAAGSHIHNTLRFRERGNNH